MFVITYLLLFYSLHECSQKRERTCLRDALASENTRLAAKHANTSPPARELARRSEPSRPARHPAGLARESGSPSITEQESLVAGKGEIRN
ncbi:hypothetical protein L596_017009 [Steinernema carpocapsae]|uniref:Uncharacterized protein n=1 Tax=Steinernema carpocapsae TaxID=34508 RepID=A0A4U5N055_STECR|nr:hypothetical protein L596_017009 [Steinernema carpocapsae]